MIISFMNSFQGRILQAHVTDSELLIQKTKLHSFRTQSEFEQSMQLFLRYIASDRVGDTRQLVSLDLNAQKQMHESADVKDMTKA